MGTVYQAVDPTGTAFAIKEMQDRFVSPDERAEGIEQFLSEAQLLTKLRHPAIPRMYGSFLDEGRYYLAMEFIQGEDVDELLRREGRLDERTVMKWAGQLCDVLGYLHAQSMVYRDMKPSNIMVSQRGNLKLIDFGIAKLLRPGERQTMLGTPGYAPPEQYQGLATPRSDVYALGATLHHLLTGRDPREFPPFTFPPARDVNRNISRQTSKALEQALNKNEGARFPSMAAFCRALPIPANAPVGAAPEMPADRQPVRPRVAEPTPRRTDARPVPSPAKRAATPETVFNPYGGARGSRLGTLARWRRRVRTAFWSLWLVAVLTGVGAVVRPDVVIPAIQGIVQQVGRVLPAGTLPNGGVSTDPVTGDVIQPYVTNNLTVAVPQGASDLDIQNALREEFLKVAQRTYPNARIDGSAPTIKGMPQRSSVVNGKQNVTADVVGRIRIPKP
ncbi:MAG: serine/threonine-protein kinase [Herpetosiphon sp.]